MLLLRSFSKAEVRTAVRSEASSRIMVSCGGVAKAMFARLAASHPGVADQKLVTPHLHAAEIKTA